MKNTLFTVFKILVALVLTGKILNWFFNFSDQTNQILNTTMFWLIGIAYLVMAYVWDNKFLKVTIAFCGLFLVLMNFVASTTLVYIIGIICLLTPMLIARFDSDKVKPAMR